MLNAARVLGLCAAVVLFWGLLAATEAHADTPAPTRKATVVVEFMSDNNNAVTWKLRPSSDVDMAVWNERANGCSSVGGASCGDIAGNGNGRFFAGQTGQYLLVTQKYEAKDGNTCKVENTAQYTTAQLSDHPEPTGAVKATYECSGASALGWQLLSVSFSAAVVAAGVMKRKHQ